MVPTTSKKPLEVLFERCGWSFTCCRRWNLSWFSSGSFLTDANVRLYPLPLHIRSNRHPRVLKHHGHSEGPAAREHGVTAQTPRRCSGELLCHEQLFTSATWVILRVAQWERDITSMCSGSTHLSNVTIIPPVDNVLTPKVTKASAGQGLQTLRSEPVGLSSLALFVPFSLVLKTGAHTFILERPCEN